MEQRYTEEIVRRGPGGTGGEEKNSQTRRRDFLSSYLLTIVMEADA